MLQLVQLSYAKKVISWFEPVFLGGLELIMQGETHGAQWVGYVVHPLLYQKIFLAFLTKNTVKYTSSMNFYVFLAWDNYFMPRIVPKFNTVGPKSTTQGSRSPTWDISHVKSNQIKYKMTHTMTGQISLPIAYFME